MNYYSARLIVVILMDDGKPKKKNNYDEQIIVFKAENYEHAFARAIEIGREQETIYENDKEQDVRWALVKVEEIKFIGKKIDGVEVISKLSHVISKTPIPFDCRFKPEKQEPHES